MACPLFVVPTGIRLRVCTADLPVAVLNYQPQLEERDRQAEKERQGARKKSVIAVFFLLSLVFTFHSGRRPGWALLKKSFKIVHGKASSRVWKKKVPSAYTLSPLFCVSPFFFFVFA